METLLALLTPLMPPGEFLDHQAIANSLYGLQSMSSESVSVRLFVQTLAGRIKLSPASLQAHEISSVMLGLRGMDPAASFEVRRFLMVL